MSIENILQKWHDTKKKIEGLEEKLKKYKNIIAKEMNKKEVDKLSAGGFTVTRRRNTRTSLCKDNVPVEIWKEYSTRSSYDVFFLSKV
jgi:hypothetical protein